MWTLIMKLPYNEVKSFLEVKSQTGLSLLRVSWKRALKKTSLTLFKEMIAFPFKNDWILESPPK